jgi:DNA-binding response OmpR family regulator
MERIIAMRILVVDDNRDVRECYRYFVEHHAVAEAENGTEALKIALKFNPELAVF